MEIILSRNHESPEINEYKSLYKQTLDDFKINEKSIYIYLKENGALIAGAEIQEPIKSVFKIDKFCAKDEETSLDRILSYIDQNSENITKHFEQINSEDDSFYIFSISTNYPNICKKHQYRIVAQQTNITTLLKPFYP